MKVNYIKTLMIGTIISGLTSCQKPLLKKTSHPLLTSKTIAVVDSFAKEGEKFVNNPEYKYFAKDTIPLNFYMSPSMLERRLNNHIIAATPKIKIGEKYEEKLKLCGKVLYNEVEKVDIKEPKYINQKAIIDNSNFYSYSWIGSAHVPVKYYGKPNPALK